MSNSILDIRQRFVSNFVWALPFGKGKRFLSSGGVASKVLGDWQFNGIVDLQTGTPFGVSAPDNSFSGPAHASYANCLGNAFVGTSGDPSVYTSTGFFLNPAAFAVPAAGTFGNCKPLPFHGPGIQDTDLSLFKDFSVTERYRLQFRAEFFNAFNHPNFSNPGPFVGFPGTFQVNSTLAPILGTDSGGPGDPREIQFALKLFF